jgi:hypothetical protein
MAAFWDVVPCVVVEIYRRFRGAYCLYCQGDEIIRQHGAIFQKAAMFILAPP